MKTMMYNTYYNTNKNRNNNIKISLLGVKRTLL